MADDPEEERRLKNTLRIIREQEIKNKRLAPTKPTIYDTLHDKPKKQRLDYAKGGRVRR